MVMRGLRPRQRCAGARVDAVAEADVLTAVHAVEAELERVVELPRVAVGGAVQHEHAGARRGGRSPPTVTGTFDSRNSPLIGGSSRSASSMNAGIMSGSSRSVCWRSGRSPRIRNDVDISRAVVSPPALNRLAAMRMTSSTGGQRAVGERRRWPAGHDVVAWLAAAVLDVRR